MNASNSSSVSGYKQGLYGWCIRSLGLADTSSICMNSGEEPVSRYSWIATPVVLADTSSTSMANGAERIGGHKHWLVGCNEL